MKHRRSMSGGALLVGLVLGMFHAPNLSATEFNASNWLPPAHPLAKFGYIGWAETLEAKSEGKLKANVFTGEVLLPAKAHLSGLKDGVAQVTHHAGTYTPSDIPEDNVIAHLAFSYSDYFTVAFATTDFNINDPQMQAMWKRNGVVYGSGYATPAYRLFCRSPVQSISDLEGKKIRTPGTVHSEWAKSIGAIPVNVASSEMYNGLEKGQLDCASNGANELRSRSLWDVSKYTTMVELGVYWAGYLHGINRNFWSGLSEQERRLLLDSFAETVVDTGLGYMAAAKQAVVDAPDHGVTVLEPTEGLKSSISEFGIRAREIAVGVAADKFNLQNADALLARFEGVVEKWQGLLSGVDRSDKEALLKILNENVYRKIDVASYGLN